MSQQEYIAIEKGRLIDLPKMPAGELFQWLATKPTWIQARVVKQLQLNNSH
ncbi:hypothetical protein TUM4438_42330 [Shewanella sairae]|uniref:Uncharacterized protein n=1 Tax=Shewanella sairae TaxID=190310 RepID=A0ABQ4PQW2_9GAMM|nr:hypothetical protein [Shewanella sairae]MCL1132429.1 hypothetical protein [Shewanella sairae]GIU51719.1 hypothetical protein TUM4438_42330 [Shewanella sairae]